MVEPTPIRGDVVAPWPEPPDEAAYYGLAGDIARQLAPHTEADPVALLATFLACAGNAIGPGTHYRIEGARHGLRLYPVLVGSTSSGRKGTALDVLEPIFATAEPDWWGRRMSGLVSGEGLIHHVRDAVVQRQAVKSGKTVLGFEDVTLDAGVADKRLLVIETELGGLLRVMTRDNSTLSARIRDAWDGKKLASMGKVSPEQATGAHITIVGCITQEELVELLTATDARNGFANRFLWLCVRRSQLLPFGGNLGDEAILAMGEVLRAAIADAKRLGGLGFDAGARPIWERVYGPLTTGEPGFVGALLGRGAPMVARIAATHAALNGASAIGERHLLAGLALWDYAVASVKHIFGPSVPVAPASPYRLTILRALAGGPLTLTEIINDVFGRNLRAPEPHATLDGLLREGLVAQAFERPAGGRGRSIQRWSITAKGAEEVAG